MYSYSKFIRRIREAYSAKPVSMATCPECGHTYMQCIEIDECPECGQVSYELLDIPYTELNFC